MTTTRFPDTTDAQITEANWTGVNAALSDSRRLEGCELTVSSGLDLSVGTGVVLVDGMRVEITVAETVALTANSLNRVWIQKDGTIYDNTSATPTAPTDFLLGVVGTDASSITGIFTDRDLALSLTSNYKWFPRKLNHVITRTLNTGTTSTLSTVDLEPGLYWVNGIIQAFGVTSFSGAFWDLKIDVQTASEYESEIAYLNHGDEGASDESTWATLGTFVRFNTTSIQLPQPVHVVGMICLSDTGSVTLTGSTSSFMYIGSSHITFRKIR